VTGRLNSGLVRVYTVTGRLVSALVRVYTVTGRLGLGFGFGCMCSLCLACSDVKWCSFLGFVPWLLYCSAPSIVSLSSIKCCNVVFFL
jgi:hypothetical protein